MVKNLRLLVVMFLWAICFPLITIGIEYAPHLTFATIRAALSGITLLIIAFYLGKKLPTTVKDWIIISIIGIGATSLAFFGMFHAAEFVSPGLATVIASTQPLMAAFLAHVFLGERLSRRGKIGLFLGFAGITLISVPQLVSDRIIAFEIGISFIVVAALGITFSNVLIKKISDKIDPMIAMGLQMIIGSIPLAIIAMVTENPSTLRWTPEFIFSLLGLSLAGTALAYWLWSKVLIETQLSYANAFTFLVPIFGLWMGVSFYGEQLSMITISGIVLTLIGIYQVAKGHTSSH